MSDCPYCRQPGAERLLWKVRCPNAACPKYDPGMSQGNLARLRSPMAESRFRTGARLGRENPGAKPANAGIIFGWLMMGVGLMSVLGFFKAYIANRGFMWGLALVYLGWKTIQSAGAAAAGGKAGEEAGEPAEADGSGGGLDEDKTSRVLYRSEEGLQEKIVLRRSVTVNGNEVTAMDSENGAWETFATEKVANIDEVRKVAQDNGQNYG